MTFASAFGLFVAIFISLISTVHGGHFLWESHLTPTHNDTYQADTLAKRQFVIKVTEGISEVWPDKTIKYCFRDPASEDKLFTALNDGVALW